MTSGKSAKDFTQMQCTPEAQKLQNIFAPLSHSMPHSTYLPGTRGTIFDIEIWNFGEDTQSDSQS